MAKKKATISAEEFSKNYWAYYLELESQLSKTKRYVDFSSKNNSTFSVEYLELLQAVCSEIDVVAKVFSAYLDPAFNGDKIMHWGYQLQQSVPQIMNMTVLFNNDYEITPWNNWEYEIVLKTDKNGKQRTNYNLKGKAKTPQWWTAYNKAKHERTSPYNNTCINYNRANLKNVVLSMAALYVLESIMRERLFTDANYNGPIQESSLFSINHLSDN